MQPVEEQTEEQRSFPLLKLPPEIRTIIYRLLLCQDKPISVTYVCLHGSILRTCRQALYESRPILYGENIFEMKIWYDYDNGVRAEYLRCCHFAEDAEWVFGPGVNEMRRIKMLVEMQSEEEVSIVKSTVRKVRKVLSKIPTLDYLHISLEERGWFDAQPLYRVVGNFALLRNVQSVVLDGVLPAYAQFLECKMAAKDEELDQLVTLQQEIPELAKDILVEVRSLVNEIDDPRGPLNGGACTFHTHTKDTKHRVCHLYLNLPWAAYHRPMKDTSQIDLQVAWMKEGRVRRVTHERRSSFPLWMFPIHRNGDSEEAFASNGMIGWRRLVSGQQGYVSCDCGYLTDSEGSRLGHSVNKDGQRFVSANEELGFDPTIMEVSGAPSKTGTKVFMAIGALYGEEHSFYARFGVVLLRAVLDL